MRSFALRCAARRAASRARAAAAAASRARRASASASAAGSGAPVGCAAAVSEACRSAVEGMAEAAKASATPRIWKGCAPPLMLPQAAITLPKSSCRRRPEGPRGSGAGTGACGAGGQQKQRRLVVGRARGARARPAAVERRLCTSP